MVKVFETNKWHATQLGRCGSDSGSKWHHQSSTTALYKGILVLFRWRGRRCGRIDCFISTRLQFSSIVFAFDYFLLVGAGLRLRANHWELRRDDWQGHSNDESAVWRGVRKKEGGGTVWQLGWGLTSQSDSSLVLHSQVYLLMVFWGGGWDGAKGYTPSKKPYQPSSERRERGATDAAREEDGDRSRQIKQERGRSSVGDTDRGPGGCQTADTPSWLQRLREKPSSILLTRLNTSGSWWLPAEIQHCQDFWAISLKGSRGCETLLVGEGGVSCSVWDGFWLDDSWSRWVFGHGWGRMVD